MLRKAGRIGFVVAMGALATALGLGSALTQTGAGRALLARLITEQSDRFVRGGVEIARIEGNFLTALELDSVVVRDTTGATLAVFPRLELRYNLANLLGGRVVLQRLRAVRPRIHLVKHRDGRMNYEEVLRLGEGPEGGGPPPLVLFRNVAIEDGIVTIRTPWSPPGHLRTAVERDSALRAQRELPGRRLEDGGRDGLVQVRTVEGLEARFAEFRISTPTRQPIRLVVDSLSALLNDPLVDLRSLRGELTTARDTLWFTAERLHLPGSRLAGEGLLAWPRDTLLFNFGFEAAQVALADFRFVSPDFPDLAGRGRLAAYSLSGLETEYDIRDLHLADAFSRVDGRLGALTHKIRGLGFRHLDLQLVGLDLDVIRPYLDTVPFTGRLSGRVRADGYFPAMQVALDWVFFDTRVEGRPPNRLVMDGEVALGGANGLVFRQTALRGADLHLPTVRLAAPTVILEGRMRGEGTLDGPWRNVIFRGRMEHRDGELPESMASGRFGLDIRQPITRLDADFAFAPLDFEGVRRTFPALTAEGRVWGPVRLLGPLDTLQVTADLQGEVGRIRAEGTVTALPPRWGADTLWLGVEDLDLQVLRGTGPPTRLNGELVLQGTVDSAVAPEGSIRARFGPGFLAELPMQAARVEVAVRDSVIVVADTARLQWAGGAVAAAGTLGWTAPHGGALDVTMDVPDLSALDSLVTALLGPPEDSTAERQRLAGALRADFRLTGARDSLGVEGTVRGEGLRWDVYRVGALQGALRTVPGRRTLVSTSVRVDSLGVGALRFGDLAFGVDGFADSLGWRAGGLGGGQTRAEAGGTWRAEEGVLAIGDLAVGLAGTRWRLLEPLRLRLADSIEFVTPLRLGTETGSGGLEAEGTLPWRVPGELDVRLLGLDLRELYALFQRDTALARGYLQGDLRIGGTGADPTIRGTLALTGPVFGDFRAPLMRAAVNYRNRRLDANLTLWRTGREVMAVGAALPLDLAWLGVSGPRRLPGELAIRAQADSMDLAALEAFTPNLRRVQGALHVDAAVSGTWEAPRLGGVIAFRNGYGNVPGLGVTLGPVTGHLELAADSILVDTLRIGSGTGYLDVEGGVQLAGLTRPILDLTLSGRSFRFIDVPDFLTLEADGRVRLQGPFTRPVMTGSATARNSVLYFRDLVTKEIVNLEDPLYADLVDTTVIRRRRLGAELQSRFLDSLTIRDFRFLAAERVWLRSNEANIQMEGSVTVNKVRRQYTLEGTFNATRGTYTLHIGPVTRGFEVERGVVRYFGTRNLDAALDVEARHVVRARDAGGQDVVVIARIGGTLLAPRLTLESTIRPPISQSDIVSILILGRPLNAQVASSQANFGPNYALNLLADALTSELERTLVQSNRVGVDMIEIRPGVIYSGVAAGTSLTRLSAGWQLGNRWFVTLNAGWCPGGGGGFNYRNFGAGLDYRLSGALTFSASAEPVQICLSSAAATSLLRYQFGTDLRWTKEY